MSGSWTDFPVIVTTAHTIKQFYAKTVLRYFRQEKTISEGSEGILLESMLEGYAEYYSAELSEKVVRGMTENALKGKNNGGQVTFGYKIDSDMHFHPHESSAPVLREIFTMYADGYTIKQNCGLFERKERAYHSRRQNDNQYRAANASNQSQVYRGI